MAKPKNKIEYHRKINFMTQSEVAEHLGMSQAGYQKIETGERRLSIDLALKMVRLFSLEKIEDLLDDESKSKAS